MASGFITAVENINAAELNQEMERRFFDPLKKKPKFYVGLDGVSSRHYLKNPFRMIFSVQRQILRPSRHRDENGKPKTPTRFVFTPFEQFSVPKADGRHRNLSKASLKNILAQKIMAKFMSPILEPHFIEHSYAYRPKRSAKMALREVQRAINEGYYYILDADISKFFDEVNHDILLARVRSVFPDEPELQHLVYRFIKTGWVQTSDFKNRTMGKIRTPIQTNDQGIALKGCYNPREKGIPQGGILSGLLANLYLNDFDHALQTRFPDVQYVRYADDFLVFCKTPGESLDVYHFAENFLKETLDLTLHPLGSDKTNQWFIEESKFHKTDPYVDFLGYRVCKSKIKIQPKNIRAYKAKMRSVIEEWIGGNRLIGSLLHRINRKMQGRLYEFDAKAGSTMIGKNWLGYFSLVSNHGQLKELDDWLAREVWRAIRKRNIPNVTKATLKKLKHQKLPTLVRLHYKMRERALLQRKQKAKAVQLKLSLS